MQGSYDNWDTERNELTDVEFKTPKYSSVTNSYLQYISPAYVKGHIDKNFQKKCIKAI